MKQVMLLLSALLFCANTYAQIAGWQTAWTYPEYPVGKTIAYDMVMDKAGNVYTLGEYKDTSTRLHGGSTLLKYSPSGQLIWRKDFTAYGIRQVVVNNVEIDTLDRLYVAGNYGAFNSPYSPPTDVNFLIDTTVSSDSTNNARCNSFLFCLDTSGHRLWNRFFTNDSGASVTGLSVNKGGQIALIGEYLDTMRVDGFTLTQPSSNRSHYYIARLDPSGHLKMLRSAFPSLLIYSCYINQTGDIYMTGGFSGWVQFGGVRLNDQSSVNVTESGFVAKFDSTGASQWISGIFGFLPPSGQGTIGGITAAKAIEQPNGNVAVMGRFNNCSASIGNGYSLPDNYQFTPFIACFNSSGNPIWFNGSPGSGSASAGDIRSDAANNIYFTGAIYDRAAWGTDTVTWGNTTSRTDAFLYKMDSAGKLQWARFAGGSIHDYGWATALTPDGTGVYMAGASASPDSMNFGTFKEPVAGATTLFVAKTGTAPLKVSDVPAASDFDVVLYPNPTTDVLRVKLTQALQLKEALIVDATGQVRLQMEAPSTHGSEIGLPVSLLPPGNYFLLLRAKDGRQSAKPFTRL